MSTAILTAGMMSVVSASSLPVDARTPNGITTLPSGDLSSNVHSEEVDKAIEQ